MGNEEWSAVEYPVLTPEDTRRTEQKAFDLGVPSLLLMEHAASAVVDEMASALGGTCKGKKVLFLCGTGNNGGDGLAAARLFLMRGGQPWVWLSGPPKTPDAKTNLLWLRQTAARILILSDMDQAAWPFAGEGPDQPYDGYVDALFGTGFRGQPDALMARMMRVPRHDFHLGQRRPPVIAVDIPSGMDGKTGAVPGEFVRADVTVTFNTPKPGLYLTKAREAVGRIAVADIGLWDMMPGRSSALRLDEMELDCRVLKPSALALLPRRPVNAHKGSCGRVLICAGKMGMAGAAAMCAKAAVTAGAGLTTVACPGEIIPVLQSLVPNAMCLEIGEAALNPPDYDVLALGCGLGQSEENWEYILKLFDPGKPSVWDADALNLLSRHAMKLGGRAVMTPHPGEAARLLDWQMEEVLRDPLRTARALAEKYACTAVLKSDVSVICAMEAGEPRYWLNAVGTPALAKGGSGDALTGILAALSAQNKDWPGHDAAKIACLWHGMAGCVGARKYGERELNTSQLIDCLFDAEKWGRGETEVE